MAVASVDFREFATRHPHSLGCTELAIFSGQHQTLDVFKEISEGISKLGVPFVNHIKVCEPCTSETDVVTFINSLGLKRSCNLLCVIDLVTHQSSRIVTAESWRKGTTSRLPYGARELSLMFPEVHFIFLVNSKEAAVANGISGEISPNFCAMDSEEGPMQVFRLLQQHLNGYRSWFDPECFRANLESSSDAAQKCKTGVAIDDEAAFLTLHGYSLYSNGLNTFLCSTRTEIERILNIDALEVAHVIEDLDLRMPDANDSAKGWLALEEKYYSEEKRSTGCSGLLEKRKFKFEKWSKKRTLVTAHKLSVPFAWESFGLRGPQVKKPHSGIYEFFLKEEFGYSEKSELASASSSSHSAGFTSQHLAEQLLVRAEKAYSEAHVTQDFILCALLCREALTILDGKTLTTSVSCFALMQKAEVEAECYFAGIQMDPAAVTKRLDYIHAYLEKLGSNQDNLQINAMEIEILTNIRRIYLKYGHFDEEIAALERARKCILNVKAKKSGKFAYNLARYSNFLIKGKESFLIGFLATFFSLCVITFLVHPGIGIFAQDWESAVVDAFRQTGTAMIALDPAGFVDYTKETEELKGYWSQLGGHLLTFSVSFLGFFITFIGYYHLGISVSMVYTKLSRR